MPGIPPRHHPVAFICQSAPQIEGIVRLHVPDVVTKLGDEIVADRIGSARPVAIGVGPDHDQIVARPHQPPVDEVRSPCGRPYAHARRAVREHQRQRAAAPPKRSPVSKPSISTRKPSPQQTPAAQRNIRAEYIRTHICRPRLPSPFLEGIQTPYRKCFYRPCPRQLEGCTDKKGLLRPDVR